jgi:hypothetical protein
MYVKNVLTKENPDIKINTRGGKVYGYEHCQNLSGQDTLVALTGNPNVPGGEGIVALLTRR